MWAWGGQDLNLRPTDYESASGRFSDLRVRQDSTLYLRKRCSVIRNDSHGFPLSCGFYADSDLDRPTLAAVKALHCLRLASRQAQKGRCDACDTYLRRHGHDKDVAAVQRGWERAIDKAFDLKDWR